MKITKKHIAYLEENYGKNILPLSIIENEDLPGTNSLEILFFWNRESTLSEAKESFFKAVEHYNLFSSRLIMIDDNKFALQYCTDGFKFNYLPAINATFDSINIDDIRKMVVNVKTLPGEALFSLTVIPITGGRFIGLRCSHAVGDAFSLIFFCFVWKCIIEGNDFPPPSTQRLFTGKPISSDEIDKAFIPPLSELSDKIQNRVKSSNTKIYSKNEYFTDEFFKEIKNQAKSENEIYIISSHQIMTAFLLKKYHDQILPNTDRIVLRTPINLREAHPDIDSMYMGNAYFSSLTEFTKDKINKMSIPQIAYHLKESVNKARNKDYVKEMIYLSKYGIEFNADIFKKYNPFNIETDISAANLTQLSDPESIGLDSNLVNILYMGSTAQTSFIMLNQRNTLFAQVTSRYPLV
jgi:hypothetical protein